MTTARIAAGAATLAAVAYYCWAAWLNLEVALSPTQFSGDHAQAVAQYWRYGVDGAMPAGDLLTDYAFLMHAPLGWWAPMALLSTFMSPLAAAKWLSVVAYVVTGALAWLIVYRKSRNNAYVAACALILIARCSQCHFFISGGYARSFGPALFLLFVAAWALWGHRAVLVVLVVQAALYPSVVIACGLTYGVYCLLAGPTMKDRLRRCITLALAGVVIVALGLMQDLRAPKEWGSVVWLEEALAMPSWGPGGRIQEAPLKPMTQELNHNTNRAFTAHGHQPLRMLGIKPPISAQRLVHVFLVAWAVLFVLVSWRRIWRGPAYGFTIPWQLPALFAGAYVGYLLARLLAFKLYLPYRVLAHSWVWIILLLMPLVAYELGLWLTKDRVLRATVFAVLLSTVTTIVVFGDGLAKAPGLYTNSAANREHFHKWVRDKTAIDALFAGDLGTMDKLPLFSHRQVLVNRVLAHPFRKGFYALVEERIRETYAALYASDAREIVAFGEKWNVDYVAYDTAVVASVDRRLFLPVKRDVAAIFRANKSKVGTGRFAIEQVPSSSVVYRHGKLRVVSIARLREALDAAEPASNDVALPGDAADEAHVDEPTDELD